MGWLAGGTFVFVVAVYNCCCCYNTPWALTHGDGRPNLENIHSGPDATRFVSWKLQQRMGTPLAVVVDHDVGVKLLRDCSWSSTAVWQSRASVSVIKRHHPGCRRPSFRLRASTRAMRRVVGRQAQDTLRMLPLDTKHQKAARRHAAHICTHRCFCKV